jgi:hypothetical protein
LSFELCCRGGADRDRIVLLQQLQEEAAIHQEILDSSLAERPLSAH